MAKRRGTGEGTIYRDCRTKGAGHAKRDHRGCRSYWVGVAEVPGGVWDDAKGRWVRRRPRVVRRSYDDCLEALRELQRQVGAGVVPDRKMTVAQWVDTYLASHLPNLSPNGQRGYRTRRNWIVKYLGNKRLTQLRRRHVAEMLAALRSDGKSAGTMQATLGLLRQACAGAVAQDILLRNPCDGVKAPAELPKTDDVPTPAEAGDHCRVRGRPSRRVGLPRAPVRSA